MNWSAFSRINLFADTPLFEAVTEPFKLEGSFFCLLNAGGFGAVLRQIKEFEYLTGAVLSFPLQ